MIQLWMKLKRKNEIYDKIDRNAQYWEPKTKLE